MRVSILSPCLSCCPASTRVGEADSTLTNTRRKTRSGGGWAVARREGAFCAPNPIYFFIRQREKLQQLLGDLQRWQPLDRPVDRLCLRCTRSSLLETSSQFHPPKEIRFPRSPVALGGSPSISSRLLLSRPPPRHPVWVCGSPMNSASPLPPVLPSRLSGGASATRFVRCRRHGTSIGSALLQSGRQ